MYNADPLLPFLQAGYGGSAGHTSRFVIMSVMDVELANAYGHCNSPALGTDARRPARLRKSGIALLLGSIQVFLREITCTSSGSGAKIRGQGELIYLTKPIQAGFLRKFVLAYRGAWYLGRGNTAWDVCI